MEGLNDNTDPFMCFSDLFMCFSDLFMCFSSDTKAAIQLAKEMDINVVTGLLKLYFRELPEALFTDTSYSSFVKGMGRRRHLELCCIIRLY